MSPFSVSCIVWSSWVSSIWLIICVMMLDPGIDPCITIIRATQEHWWRSLTQCQWQPWPVFSKHVSGTLFCPSRTTGANPCHCLINTHNIWLITAQYAAVRFRPIMPSLGAVTNPNGWHQSCNLSCISVSSSLPICACMWNLATWSAE